MGFIGFIGLMGFMGFIGFIGFIGLGFYGLGLGFGYWTTGTIGVKYRYYRVYIGVILG